MIQSIVFFSLGFLSAAFLAALVIPAVWKRAVSLTRRRIERSVPLTQAEIAAAMDGQRAEFAVSARRLEMEAQSLRQKLATQTVEINRASEDMKKMSRELEGRQQAISVAGAQAEELAAQIASRDQRIGDLIADAAKLRERIDELQAETARLASLYEEASFVSSSRQIELVARESELEKVRADLADMRTQRKDMDRRHRELAAEGKAAREALKTEQKKAAELDKKLTRLLATLADREEKLERRERELARLRDRAAPGYNGGDGSDDLATRLHAERERLEVRLTSLTRENKRLRNERATLPALKGEAAAETDDGQLRETIQQLAAEMVDLSVRIDGPHSPIEAVLAESPVGENKGSISLADRIRALRQERGADT